MPYVHLLVGLVILTFGADQLVRNASNIARALGISPLIVGLTVVAFGTSAPEMAVSVSAVQQGSSDISVANVVGSNSFNLLFILGLAAIIAPLTINRQLQRLDVPVMVGATLLLWWFMSDGTLGLLDGIVFCAAIVMYLVLLFRIARRERKEQLEQEKENGVGKPRLWLSILLVVVGLGMLVFGAHWMVQGAVEIAHSLGISETVIGLTVIAAGTSLPELATSVVASIRGQRDIAVGNVVGSNIFNIFAILGIASLVSNGTLAVNAHMQHFDIPLMVMFAVLCIPFFWGGVFSRWKAASFLLIFGAYTAALIWREQASPVFTPLQDHLLLYGPAGMAALTLLSLMTARQQSKASVTV